MANYKKYISMGVSMILIPLAKKAISKFVNNQGKKLKIAGAVKALEVAKNAF